MKTRYIKFRAWRDGEMLYQQEEGTAYAAALFNRIHKQHPVMQFTGLLDKNGKEIYEGDLIKDNFGHIWDVRFESGCFWLHREGHGNMNQAFSWPKDSYPMFRVDHDMYSEVIGNIYKL